jgi:hypothetical protein
MARFVVVGSSWVYGNFSIIEGDVMALIVAVKELLGRDFTNVICETDSKTVADVIYHS